MGILFFTPQVFAATPADLEISVSNPGAQIFLDRKVEDGKLVVSVEDAQKKLSLIHI